jgi:hypothetical protein
MDQKQATRILGLSVLALERHRLAGEGPRYIRFARRPLPRDQSMGGRNSRGSISEMSWRYRQAA